MGLVVLWEYVDHLVHSVYSHDNLPGSIRLVTAWLWSSFCIQQHHIKPCCPWSHYRTHESKIYVCHCVYCCLCAYVCMHYYTYIQSHANARHPKLKLSYFLLGCVQLVVELQTLSTPCKAQCGMYIIKLWSSKMNCFTIAHERSRHYCSISLSVW